MAGTYDPQIVGSHFVKQYYTQLHKDPVQLHRFYLDQSSYVHGSSEIGSEEAVVGQKAIHEKILSINFKSVHAKIKQVDSHATLGEGIVIQVTGELSVNGQPMRAFVQTFVLAPESPKKYYVHNDIFRYQDDAYDITSESENNEGMTEREQDVVQVPPTELYQTGQPSQPQPQQQQQQQLTEVDITLQNGNRRSSVDQSPPGKEPWTQYNDVSGHAESVSSDTSTPLEMLPQPSDSPEPTYKTNESDTGLQTEDVRMNTPVGGSQDYPAEEDKGQLSWASRISQATGATITKSQPPATNQVIQQPPPPPAQQQQPAPSQPPHEVRKKPSSENTLSAVNRSGGGGSGGFGNPDSSRRAVARSVPDTYQLFVGGLPPGTTEQELRSVFEQYGRILEIRNNPNNFAFLVFDSEKPVKSILQKKEREPPKIRGKQLNIEKKKPSEAVRARTGFRRDPPSGSPGQRGSRGAPKNSKR